MKYILIDQTEVNWMLLTYNNGLYRFLWFIVFCNCVVFLSNQLFMFYIKHLPRVISSLGSLDSRDLSVSFIAHAGVMQRTP